MQTTVANFAKNPFVSPVANWPKYVPGNRATVAKLAYNGNVEPSNFVEAASSESLDGPCTALWDALLLNPQ
jgi:hypothetical protein